MRNLFLFNDLVKSYQHLFKRDTIFFFDIEGTILKTNIYHEVLYQQKYMDILKNVCERYNENHLHIARYGRFFNRRLTDKSLYTLLQMLKKNKSETCILTFAKYSFDREKALKDQKIYFNNQIWTSGGNKGEFISEFLKRKKQFTKIFFIDDKIEHITNVEEVFFNLPQYEIFTFLYEGTKNLEVTEEGFRSFWTSVLINYQERKNTRIK